MTSCDVLFENLGISSSESVLSFLFKGKSGPSDKPSPGLQKTLDRALSNEPLELEDAMSVVSASVGDIPYILVAASEIRDRGKGKTLTFSRNVFVPLTQLCRNHCGYCTFKYEPEEGPLFMTPEEIVELARKGAALGCTELLQARI